MFIDEAKIIVKSGKGGDGMVHFRREKYVPRGGPDGGDGGKGGDVVLEVLHTLNTLGAFRHTARFQADNGQNGAKQNMTGRSGEDLVIPVPPGTLVYEDLSGELLGDLVEPGQRLVAVVGGRGGRGNIHFANSVHQVPRVAEKGEPSQERNLRLELKLIADVGIVGVPNAGKSTFLAAVTNARPKIAPYPFTTLEPNLGVVELDEETSLILADIPGLIEGAHQGVGLGDAFLRHIQRTRVLIHLLDGLSEDPVLDYAQINSELALFDPALARKPQVVAVNKIDQPEVKERWPRISAELKRRLKNTALPEPYAISALARTGLREVLYKAHQLLQELPEEETIAEPPVYRPETDPREFTIERTSSGWRVAGAAIERAAEMTYWEHYQSVRRFQRLLEAIGIEEALRKAGIQNGDSVAIGNFELEWQD
jgi:GTP-binding protein